MFPATSVSVTEFAGSRIVELTSNDNATFAISKSKLISSFNPSFVNESTTLSTSPLPTNAPIIANNKVSVIFNLISLSASCNKIPASTFVVSAADVASLLPKSNPNNWLSKLVRSAAKFVPSMTKS